MLCKTSCGRRYKTILPAGSNAVQDPLHLTLTRACGPDADNSVRVHVPDAVVQHHHPDILAQAP
eukprot:4426122-Pyramimonas_sp.AAC.1